ncbi:MAG TPA: ATP-binding protein, partial [Longimicrobiales bacterium]|nr:ATP-binding protein [Longimicrobiales bacterium]
WPAVLAVISLLVLGSYLAYTQYLVREIRREAAIHSQVYSIVQRGLAGDIEGGPERALHELQQQLQNLQVPIIVFDAEGEPAYANNLPFEYDMGSPEGVEQVRAYAARLAASRPRNRSPVQGGGSMVFGDPPVLSWLRFIPWLQVGAGVLLIAIALILMRASMRAHQERLWSAMARELAHQMGTPLSSLAGWVEVLQLTAEERTAMTDTDHIGRVMQADVERLERVSRRFELIGKPPALERVAAGDVVNELVSYFRPRLPHLGKGITLRARIDPDLPSIRANQVLLVWALENIIKNAIDALAGRGGRISFMAMRGGRPPVAGSSRDSLHLVITDNGPGIAPAVRDRIFEPGVPTKAGGWGVGLSLSLRIIEELHHGRITLHNRQRGGTVFDVVLPVAKM